MNCNIKKGMVLHEGKRLAHDNSHGGGKESAHCIYDCLNDVPPFELTTSKPSAISRTVGLPVSLLYAIYAVNRSGLSPSCSMQSFPVTSRWYVNLEHTKFRADGEDREPLIRNRKDCHAVQACALCSASSRMLSQYHRSSVDAPANLFVS
jgi:hypothetical protein